jgi:hypothetical protein
LAAKDSSRHKMTGLAAAAAQRMKMRRRGGQLMDGYLPTHARQHAAYLFGTAASARSEGPKACCGGCVRNGRVVSNSLVKLLPRHRGHKHYHTLLFIHGLSRQAERLSPGEGLTEGYPAHHPSPPPSPVGGKSSESANKRAFHSFCSAVGP